MAIGSRKTEGVHKQRKRDAVNIIDEETNTKQLTQKHIMIMTSYEAHKLLNWSQYGAQYTVYEILNMSPKLLIMMCVLVKLNIFSGKDIW